jgi:dihydrofolate reductase
MEAPGGESGYKHTGWVMRYPDAGQYQYKLNEVMAHEALLLGRRTYEGFAAAWPSRSGEFADKFNSMPKYVASTTMQSADWNNTTILQGDVPAAVARLKQQLGGDIIVNGSRTLVNSLKQHDLIDEYHLQVFPVVLGSGMRLFDDAEEVASLRLIDVQRFDSGTLALAYEPVRA